MTIPDYITHYYLADRQPFLSLSELDLKKHNYIFDELLNRHKTDPSYHRRYGKNYIDIYLTFQTPSKIIGESSFQKK